MWWWCTGILYTKDSCYHWHDVMLSAGLQFFLLIIAVGPDWTITWVSVQSRTSVWATPASTHWAGLAGAGAGDNRLNLQSEWGKYPEMLRTVAVWFIWNDDSNANFKMWGISRCKGGRVTSWFSRHLCPSYQNTISSPLLSSLFTVVFLLQIKLFCLSFHGWDWLNKGCEDEGVGLTR